MPRTEAAAGADSRLREERIEALRPLPAQVPEADGAAAAGAARRLVHVIEDDLPVHHPVVELPVVQTETVAPGQDLRVRLDVLHADRARHVDDGTGGDQPAARRAVAEKLKDPGVE